MTATLHALWLMQSGECFYCGRATWTNNEGKAARKVRLGMSPHASRAEMRRRQATIEHLQRRADGGGNSMSNFVMACVDCNEKRGPRPVLLHLSAQRNQYAEAAE